MQEEVKRPKKDFKIEGNISWMVAGILGIISGVSSTFQNKLLCWVTGVLGVIAFMVAIYFLLAKPKPLEPSVAVWVDSNE